MSQNNHSAGTPRQRTRQGCLTCRKRRRKCDEKKPRCQSCTLRGLVCRYGLQLTFLEANNFSLLPGEARALQESCPAIYRNIRFIDGLDSSQCDILNQHEQDDGLSACDVPSLSPLHAAAFETNVGQALLDLRDFPEEPARQPKRHFYASYFNGDDHEDFASQNRGESGGEEASHRHQIAHLHTPDSGHSSTLPRNILCEELPGAHLSQEDHLAMRRLSSRASLPAVPPGLDQSSGKHSGKNWLPLIGIISENFRSNLSTHDLCEEHSLSNKKNSELLKFYIDEVAPWLDLCSPQHSFGIHLPILASKYPPLRCAILALASQQRVLFPHPDNICVSQSDELIRLATSSIGSDLYSSREEIVAACAILTICELLPFEVRDWRHILKKRIDVFGLLDINGESDGLLGSVAWAILRLDLALAMSSHLPLLTAIEKWDTVSIPFSNLQRMSSETQSSPEWCRLSILLCARAAQLCFSHEDSSSPTHGRFTWAELWSSSQSWFHNLPSPMLPIITSPISTSYSTPPLSFPLIVYTCRLNLYAAVMHQTTCLLILQAKPPSCHLPSQPRTPTWHAVQICGICLGNNARWSWDPAILTALMYAGQLLSYQQQKEELVEFLTGAVAESGWKLGCEIEKLEEGWRFDGGFQMPIHEPPSFSN